MYIIHNKYPLKSLLAQKIMRTFLLLLFLLPFVAADTPDPYVAQFNFTYTSSIYEIFPNYTNISTPFAQGDAILIEARMQGKDPSIAIPYYQKALQTANIQEQALFFETIASIENNPALILLNSII